MQNLRPFLDPLAERYSEPSYLSSDPLEFVHRYSDPWDQEAVALIAALLAYGNVKQIRRSVVAALARMEGAASGPADFVRQARTPGDVRVAFDGFVHRFNTGRDLAVLSALLARSWREHGSLGAHLLGFLAPEAPDFSEALARLIAEWRLWAREFGEVPGSFDYLLTSPEDGSCCKRWCMLLRWMGRRDRLDPGLWTEGSPLAGTFPAGRFLRPSQLVIPLDTHTGRISQYLGLTRRKSLNWKAALEVTERLRDCSPEDPVRYDFALARLGILELCQKRFDVEVCLKCELLPVCRFAARRARSRRKS